MNHVNEIDDMTSDASTIAFALSATCAEEYDHSTEAIINKTENKGAARNIRERRDTKDHKIQDFLPIVLSNRHDKNSK